MGKYLWSGRAGSFGVVKSSTNFATSNELPKCCICGHRRLGWIFALESSDDSYETFLKDVGLNYTQFAVPPDGTAIFQVSVDIYSTCANDNGSAIADLSDDQFDFFVLCPYVLIEVLTQSS